MRQKAASCVLALLCLAVAAWATSNPVDSTVQLSVVETATSSHVRSDNSSIVGGSDSGPHFRAADSLGASKAISPSKQRRLAELYAENVWKNNIALQILPTAWREAMPHWAQTWFRNWLMGTALYFGVGVLWAYYCYFCFGDRLYPPGHIPTLPDMVEQMKVATLAMPLYAALPTATEYIVEQGWTLAYSRISDMGIANYILYFVLYMTSVEFFVYWQHRLLHDIHVGYRYLHHVHHKYNKEHTLSPFAGLAFHPIDGILQAIPYSWTLLFVPMHFFTHELLLFATAIWTTNIHDCLHGKVEPIMGAGYHTIHHTTYKHNYGHYFTYMDRIFGTLITPEAFEEKHRDSGSKTS